MKKLAELLHLADSSIPTGSFAYSYGLESSITYGLVNDIAHLKNYIYSYLQQVINMEIPFINSCYRLELPEQLDKLKIIVDEYDAMMLVPSMYRASIVQGKNWSRLLESFYNHNGLSVITEWIIDLKLPFHYSIILPVMLKKAGAVLEEIILLTLHMALRDKMSAAIRLGFIGPMEAHKLQHDFYELFEGMLGGHINKEYEDAYRSAFMLDTAQVFHEDIYSKLFQN